MNNRVRPQKINSLSAADKARSKGRKITWIPPNGNGIGYWKGRRQYFENGIIQKTKSPVLTSAINLSKGAVIGGLKGWRDLAIGRPGKRDTDLSIYGLGRDLSNSLPVFLQPRVIAAMGRTRRNIDAVGRPIVDLDQVAANQAALRIEGASGFSAKPDTIEEKQLAPKTRAIDASGPRRSTVKDEEVTGQGGLPLGSTTKRGGETTLTKQNIKVDNPRKTPVNKYGINERELKRYTGKSLKEFERDYRANQVFDTTKDFGTKKGGFFVNDVKGVPRFIPHVDRK